MLELKVEFDDLYKSHFGDNELMSPVFYRFPIGIRYEMGIGLVYDEAYIKSVVSRAISIFRELFNNDDVIYIVINSYEDNPNDLADNDITTARPLINCIEAECKFTFSFDEDELMYNSHTRYIIKATVKSIQVEKLLEEIAWSDVDGRNSLRSCVYWFNPRNGIIYYLYDDRGLDVVSGEKANIEHIYSKFNEWILEYDRERTDNIFAL